MTDDPHAQEHRDEASFMLAAERSVKALTDRLDKAETAARWRKVQVRILGIVCAVLIVIAALGTVQYIHVTELTSRVQQGSIAQCENGNSVRQAEVRVWDNFVTLILKGDNSAKDRQLGAEFEKQVSRVFAPHNCTKVFNVSDGR